MKKFTIISRVSLLIIKFAMIMIPLGALFALYGIFTISGEAGRPESTEGMEKWSTSKSIKINRYELSKVSSYTSEEGFEDYVELLVPHPRVSDISHDAGPNNLKLVNKGSYEISAVMQEPYYIPVIYQIRGANEIRTVQFIFVLVVLISLSIALLILWVLKELMFSIARGNFFIRKNYKRLIILSIPSFLLPFLDFGMDMLSSRFFMKNFQVLNGGVYSVPTPDMTTVIFGVISLLIAGVVYEGCKLKEEQDLTI